MEIAGTILLISGGTIAAVSTVPIIAGFGTAGIIAGTTAAAVQSGIGLVSAGSAFATMTSLGMQGYFVGSAIVGGVASASGALISWLY